MNRPRLLILGGLFMIVATVAGLYLASLRVDLPESGSAGTSSAVAIPPAVRRRAAEDCGKTWTFLQSAALESRIVSPDARVVDPRAVIVEVQLSTGGSAADARIVHSSGCAPLDQFARARTLLRRYSAVLSRTRKTVRVVSSVVPAPVL